MTTTPTTRYIVAVVSPNAWTKDSDGRCHPVIERRCTHKHRTIAGALRCLDDLVGYNRDAGTWSANWHRAHVRHADDSPLTDDEMDQILDATGSTYAAGRP